MKHLFIFSVITLSASFAASASSDPVKIDPIKVEDVKVKIDEIVEDVKENIQEGLNTPIVIVNQNSDTLFKSNTDTATTGAETIIQLNIPENNDTSADITTMQYEMEHLKQKSRNARISLFFAWLVPCFIIFVAIIAIFIFLIYRIRSRNKIINKAIENNYQLPESFYSGRNAEINNYYTNNSDNSNYTHSPMPETTPESENLPPLPPQAPNQSPWKALENKQVMKGLVMAGIGLVIGFFFAAVDAPAVGLLIGGILLVIGLSKSLPHILSNRN